MTSKIYITVAAAVLACGPAWAQQFTGGQLSITYEAPSDGGDFGGTTYSAGGEYAINRDFSVAADVSGYRLDNIDTDASSVTLHGIYHLSDTASAGLFIGQDYANDDTANVYGIEGGTEFMGGDVGGFFGRVDGDNDATIFGVDGSYALRNGFSLIGNAGIASTDTTDTRRYAVGAEYQLSTGLEFYAELGKVTAEVGSLSDDQTYIGVGATIAFGSGRGTTFDQRSLFEILPGF